MRVNSKIDFTNKFVFSILVTTPGKCTNSWMAKIDINFLIKNLAVLCVKIQTNKALESTTHAWQ